MNHIDELVAWLQTEAETAGYVLSRGAWNDSPELDGKRIMSIQGTGGRNPDVCARFPLIRIIMLGRKGERRVAGATKAIETFAQALAEKTFSDYSTEKLAQVRLVGDIIGPGYTTEDRPWYEINLELTI